MKITNKHNLPEAIVKAVSNKTTYSGHDEIRNYSITQLLSTPRIFWLTKRHDAEMEEDVMDKIYQILGSSVHYILEKANEDSPNHVIEKRFTYTTDTGKVITGGLDSINIVGNILEDWKLTSVYTWIYRNRNGSRVEEYTKQLNMYRFLAAQKGYKIDKLKIHMIFRDYNKKSGQYDRNYPNIVETIDIPVWGLDVSRAFLEETVNNFESCKNIPDDELPICTPEERWQTQTTYAVRKSGLVKAKKVLFSQLAAKKWIDEECDNVAKKKVKQSSGEEYEKAFDKAKSLYYIEKRYGENLRCQGYCPCKDFCNFYQQLGT